MLFFVESTNSLIILLLTTLLPLIIFMKWSRRSTNKLPPGPPGLPIIGNLHQIKSPSFLTYYKLSQQYGDIFHFHLGQCPAIFLNSLEHFKNLMTQDTFSGQIKSKFQHRFVRNSGIVFIDGEKWKFHKRLALQIFRDLGKSRSESIIQQEAEELIQYLDALCMENDGFIETSSVFSCATINIISTLLLSERPGYKNKEFNQFIDDIHILLNKKRPMSTLPILFPILGVLSPLFNLSSSASIGVALLDFVQQQLKRHHDKSSSKETNNFVEAYYSAKEQNGRKMEKSWMEYYFNDWQIVRLVFEMYIAGMDTSATVLSWTTLLLGLHNSVRDKMEQEIHNVIGREKIVDMNDRKHFQYSLAVIDEIMRFASVVPTLIHRVMEDTKIGEFDIPKDTLAVGNLYSVHHNATVWEKPNDFYPQHFLSEDGFTYRPREHLIPFGIGKRSCLAESLGRAQVFILIITLVQRYRFQVHFDHEKGESLEKCLDGTDGTVRAPGNHKIQFSRNA